jgi:hypothetical protein
MTTTTAETKRELRKGRRNLKEMLQVRCSTRWLGMGLAGAGLGAAAVYWGGLPAALTLGTLGAVGLTYATVIEPACPVLKRVTLPLPTLPPELDGLRIGQLSDMHLGLPHTAANTRWAVAQMGREQPDMIVITGDFVSFESAIDALPELLRPLHAPLGVYAITGNHDHWEGVEAIYAQVEPLGIRFLVNANTRLSWNGGEFWLAGIDDMWYGEPDLYATLDGIPADAFTMLLAHEPDIADVAIYRNIAVQLSGHTHGGHIDLPYLGIPCLPNHGVNYASGLFALNDMLLYVSRGLGGFPLRVNCLPEATILTLRQSTHTH